MQCYCYKNQRDLTHRVSFAWEMQAAPDMEARADQKAWDMVLQAATQEPCVCHGRWVPLTEELLERQVQQCPPGLEAEAPRPALLRKAIRHALQSGAQKHANVCFWGPASSGKSHVLKPLVTLFKDLALTRPVGKSNFPLQQIFGKKVVVLQDFRTTTYKLSFDEYLVWWEGEAFDVPIKFGSDKTYNERAPVFISTGNKPRIAPNEAKALEVDAGQQNAMMDKRLRYFHFAESLSLEDIVEVAPCASCFAAWVAELPGGATAAHSPAPAMPQAIGGGEQPSASLPSGARGLASAKGSAADALVDWLETHGGEIRSSGVACNLSLVSDSVSWGTRFHADCGRLVSFLRQHGCFDASKDDVVIGIDFGQ